MDPKSRLIFPLDVPDKARAQKLMELLRGEVGLFKVGLELFLAEGPEFLKFMADAAPGGFFLDLKLHDIPATMGAAHSRIFRGVRFTTIHCDQGRRLLTRMVQGLSNDIKVLGVTVLTSLDKEDLLSVGIDPRYAENPGELVLLRAQLAKEAGCRGVVCAGPEAGAVKERFGQGFLVVCPGIRPAWARVPADDQRRTMTPHEAIRAGADYVVVGRPIRLADDPVAAARKVVEEIARGLADREFHQSW
ncbi:MAG: orotidine-5'-phosphate decarboxylase [Deltaproteobacteria bacterium]|nr:orotidine-5'-phosphate decarboxylase [Deltaproteobacteria bacterium]